jgi:BA14K-like protein
MRTAILTIALTAATMLSASIPAAAHRDAHGLARPYAIEKTCNDRYRDCDVRMLYAPGQNPGLAGPGSYWFPRATRAVRVWSLRHMRWCQSRYRTYDDLSDTFIGKGHRQHRCNSPYDGV